jgi:hypothetical protein
VSKWLLFNRVSDCCLTEWVSDCCLTEWVSDCCLTEWVSDCCLTEWVSDCCLTEWVSDCCLTEWVSDCCLMPNEQLFSYTMVRISWSLKRWWCPLCTSPSYLVGFSLVIIHWNNKCHSTQTHWFWVNQSLLLLLNTVYLA